MNEKSKKQLLAVAGAVAVLVGAYALGNANTPPSTPIPTPEPVATIATASSVVLYDINRVGETWQIDASVTPSKGKVMTYRITLPTGTFGTSITKSGVGFAKSGVATITVVP